MPGLRNLFIAAAAGMSLSSCALFETILGGVSDIQDANASGPLFAYRVASQDERRIVFATVTPEQTAIQTGATLERSATLLDDAISPNRRWFAASGRGVFFVFDVSEGRFHDLFTSTVDATYLSVDVDPSGCDYSELEAMADGLAQAYLRDVVGLADPLPEFSAELRVSLSREFDFPVWRGWVGPDAFQFEMNQYYYYVLDIAEIPEARDIVLIGETYEAAVNYTFENDPGTGRFVVSDCDAPPLPVIEPAAPFDLSIDPDTETILIDGRPLLLAGTGVPLDSRRIVAVTQARP